MVGYLYYRLSLQPPYSFSMKQSGKIADVVSLSKDSVSRGWYYLNQRIVEDPTNIDKQITRVSDFTTYTELDKMHSITFSKKKFNYSNPIYAQYKDVIVNFEFSNGGATTKVKLKQTTKLADFFSYIGGIITSTLLVFRLTTRNFQVFNSDFQIYESFNTTTTGFRNDRSSTAFEPVPRKKSEQRMGYWNKLRIYLGYFSHSSWLWCCFWKRGTKMKKKIKKIKKIQ